MVLYTSPSRSSIISPYDTGVAFDDEIELDELILELLERAILEDEIFIIVELDTRFSLEELSALKLVGLLSLQAVNKNAKNPANKKKVCFSHIDLQLFRIYINSFSNGRSYALFCFRVLHATDRIGIDFILHTVRDILFVV